MLVFLSVLNQHILNPDKVIAVEQFGKDVGINKLIPGSAILSSDGIHDLDGLVSLINDLGFLSRICIVLVDLGTIVKILAFQGADANFLTAVLADFSTGGFAGIIGLGGFSGTGGLSGTGGFGGASGLRRCHRPGKQIQWAGFLMSLTLSRSNCTLAVYRASHGMNRFRLPSVPHGNAHRWKFP